MKQVIELLGKTVKFVHTENGHFFEEQGKVTEVLLSLNGQNQISIDEKELYLLSDLLELEIV
ncbi:MULTISPECIES: hypothetical protein [unclassified Acinetobacter]|uniref:hypothetical protein n=1 Tax=unclassified Acinetobacter TaxID=196816 RepID=UPI0015D10B15|nr:MULTISPECIES: hypothetical protein [unclassified Acinetobacter]